MRNLIRRILKEDTGDLYYNDSIINKPNYGGSDKTTNFNTYNVFVSGIESTWNHTIQRNEFDKEYTSNLPLKQFRYRSSSDWDKNIKPLFIKFLTENSIDKVILFSAGCYAANTASDIVGKENVYCIEPYKTSSKWSNIDSRNFYVNEKYPFRGSIAKSNIPLDNINKLNNSGDHINALSWSVKKFI